MELNVRQTPERQAFYQKIDGENLSALWNVMNSSPRNPRVSAGRHDGSSMPSAVACSKPQV